MSNLTFEKAEAADDIFQACFESARSPLILLTDDGGFVGCNAASREWLPPDVMPGQSLLAELSERPKRLGRDLARSAAEGTARSVSVAPASGEQRVDMVGRLQRVSRDPVTLMLELIPPPNRSDGVAELRRQLSAKAHETECERRRRLELEASYRDLERFAGMVSHDLRDPLGHITAALRIYRAQVGEAAGIPDDRWLDIAEAGTERLSQLIDGFLALARHGHGALHRDPVDLEALLREVMEDHADQVEAARARVHVGQLPVVIGDELLLRQLFSNLVSNALKYRARDRRLRISVDSLPDADGSVSIVLSDNGSGFDPADRERIFEAFHRLPHTEHLEGSGFGLSTCKLIAERHGWRICGDGRPNEFARFTLHVAAIDLEGLARAG